MHSKCAQPQHLRQNWGAAQAVLTREQAARLDRLAQAAVDGHFQADEENL